MSLCWLEKCFPSSSPMLREPLSGWNEVIKWTQIFQCRTITELVLILKGGEESRCLLLSAEEESYFSLNKRWSLRAQEFHRLKDIDKVFVSYSFEHNTQCDENTRSPSTWTERNDFREGLIRRIAPQYLLNSEQQSVLLDQSLLWSCELVQWNQWNLRPFSGHLVLATRCRGNAELCEIVHPSRTASNANDQERSHSPLPYPRISHFEFTQ